jgi:hypothetical protein
MLEDLDDMNVNELKNEIRSIISTQYGNYCGMCSRPSLDKAICECGADLRKQRLESYDIELMIKRGAVVIPNGDGTCQLYPRKRRGISTKLPPAYPKVKVTTE